MFTVKLYSNNGARQRIVDGESFTILRSPKLIGSSQCARNITAEITVHQKNSNEDRRYDVGAYLPDTTEEGPELFEKAIIENALGRTTEIIVYTPR